MSQVLGQYELGMAAHPLGEYEEYSQRRGEGRRQGRDQRELLAGELGELMEYIVESWFFPWNFRFSYTTLLIFELRQLIDYIDVEGSLESWLFSWNICFPWTTSLFTFEFSLNNLLTLELRELIRVSWIFKMVIVLMK